MLSICNSNIDNFKPLESFVNLENTASRNFYLATLVSSGSSLASWAYLVTMKGTLSFKPFLITSKQPIDSEL